MIISVHSGKGGVGKTSLIANLGAALARSGTSTLLVDLDFGTRGLTNFFSRRLPRGTSVANIYDVFFEGHEVSADTLTRIEDNLYFLPSMTLERMREEGEPIIGDILSQGLRNNVVGFAESIRSIQKSNGFGLVLVDTRSGADMPSAMPAFMSDIFWIVTEEDRTNLRVADQLIRLINRTHYSISEDLSRRPGPRFDAFIVNQAIYEGTQAVQFINGAMASTFAENCISYIPLDQKAKRSFVEDEFTIDRFPRSVYSSEIKELARFVSSLITQQTDSEQQGSRVQNRLKAQVQRRITLWSGSALLAIALIVVLAVFAIPRLAIEPRVQGLDIDAVGLFPDFRVDGTITPVPIIVNVTSAQKLLSGLTETDFNVRPLGRPREFSGDCAFEIAQVEETPSRGYVVSLSPTGTTNCDWAIGSYTLRLEVKNPDTQEVNSTFTQIRVN